MHSIIRLNEAIRSDDAAVIPFAVAESSNILSGEFNLLKVIIARAICDFVTGKDAQNPGGFRVRT
jgi:hypothetical protein